MVDAGASFLVMAAGDPVGRLWFTGTSRALFWQS
jgi:hypothetical protein